ncbi:MAG: amino acid permease [Phycisphaerales bacterium]|nr:amino acid permease [Phycisphaerales bacterium]
MPEPIRPDLPRTIGFWGAIGIMVGVTIGSGIFATPAGIARELGSPALILGLWGLGGLLSLFGALTYAELATIYPRSGGLYNYLENGLGRGVAFVFGWTYMVITKPFAAAGIAVIMAEHLDRLTGLNAGINDALGLSGGGGGGGGGRWAWGNAHTVIAVLTVLTAVNVRGMRLGSGISLVFSTLKVLALAAIVVLGLALMKGSVGHFSAGPAPKAVGLAIAPVMLAILWTYDGWSDVGSISGEVRDPQRMLPRIFFIGTGLVVALYLAVNAVYIYVLPLEEMRGTRTVAPLVMERLVGPGGATIVTAMIVISTLGATHASIITGARVTFAQAQDRLLFGFLGRIHPRYQTPAVSLWSQLAFSCAAVLMQGGSFATLADGFTFTMWVFYGLAAVAVIVLRIRRPDLPRTYRCWGYPFVPLAFIGAAAGMTALSIWDSPAQKLAWLGVLAAGLPVYLVWKRWFLAEEAGGGGASG